MAPVKLPPLKLPSTSALLLENPGTPRRRGVGALRPQPLQGRPDQAKGSGARPIQSFFLVFVMVLANSVNRNVFFEFARVIVIGTQRVIGIR